ncbi:sensor domain-containing diguanylate cyclase [uncultured Marinobacter sp.]|mgnify:CR=1 FL=1|uniref:GGDEF domain-containing protein n=1 Tax=uncultured Marinobacter sp. TaxID=187379 RepID=UPI0025DA9AE1|nr:sensor domain-containing diguanylate cyclase [uncultured Marinobacter sp.]
MTRPKARLTEQIRVQALHELRILDTPAEERFDRLTRLAKRLFDVPIALVSLVDSERQWFKSNQDLPVRQTPREISFCHHAISQEDVFVVPDASLHPGFLDNPLVTGPPHIRFYAGYVLKLANGLAMGTLCIIDSKPRSFFEEDLQALRDLGMIAENELAAIQLAIEDDLTGLPNRRGFLHQAQKTINLCYRLGRPAALIYFDLTHFKTINDKHGHHEGDAALRAFANLLRGHTRESDISARMGGDEFVLLMNDTTVDQASRYVERLRESVNQHNSASGKPYEILFDEGVVPLDLEQEHFIETLLQKADAEMFKQKRKVR